MVGFAFSSAYPSSCYYLLSYHFIIPATKLFYFNLARLLWACRLFFPQWPSKAIGSCVTLLAGSCVPFVFPWASRACLLSLNFLGLFPNFALPWAFTEFFRLLQPKYVIPHPWDLWACHQPLTFFTFITLGLSWLILTFPHHILSMVCFFFLSELL